MHLVLVWPVLDRAQVDADAIEAFVADACAMTEASAAAAGPIDPLVQSSRVNRTGKIRSFGSSTNLRRGTSASLVPPIFLATVPPAGPIPVRVSLTQTCTSRSDDPSHLLGRLPGQSSQLGNST